MKLSSMKQAPEAKAKEAPDVAGEYREPDYPYGLRISLDDDQLTALGVDALPVAGAPVALEAIGTVMSVSEETVDNGKARRRLEVQITDMAMATPGTSKYAKMYPDMKD